jgi:HTH-type transcriptional regulator / antitoxin HigA
MSKLTGDYNEEFLYPRLREDDQFAVDYLTECIQDNDSRTLLLSLQNIAAARSYNTATLPHKAGIVHNWVNITNKKDHDAAIALAGHLMDVIDDQAGHPLDSLLDFVVDGIKEYEDRIYAHPTLLPLEMLEFLMEQHGMKQKDLADILGGKGVTSEILSGKREMNKRQIKALSKHFNVSPVVFFIPYS